MFDHVQFTGTINLGAISTAILTLLGLYIVYWRGKIREQKTREIFHQESEKLQKCIHQVPGHPENQSVNPKNANNQGASNQPNNQQTNVENQQ